MTGLAEARPGVGTALAVPRHLGLILDGNRRWARTRGLSAPDGHRAGFGRIPEVLGWCEDLGVRVVTLWLLSTDNLRREPSEVDALIKILSGVVDELARQDRWHLRHLGVRSAVRQPLLDALDRAVAGRPWDGDRLLVNLAICYGGQDEVVDACRTLLSRYAAEGISSAEAAARLTPDAISEIVNQGMPEPDLVIRTSGEQRSSGFLLWSGMETEYLFTQTYWPDFGSDDLKAALGNYRGSRPGAFADSTGVLRS